MADYDLIKRTVERDSKQRDLDYHTGVAYGLKLAANLCFLMQCATPQNVGISLEFIRAKYQAEHAASPSPHA